MEHQFIIIPIIKNIVFQDLLKTNTHSLAGNWTCV